MLVAVGMKCSGAILSCGAVAVFLPIFFCYLDRMLAAIKERTSFS